MLQKQLNMLYDQQTMTELPELLLADNFIAELMWYINKNHN